MVAYVKLGQSIGNFGKEIRVMAVHMHSELANGRWVTKLEGFLDLVSSSLHEAQCRRLHGGLQHESLQRDSIVPQARSHHRLDGAVTTLGRIMWAFVASIHVASFA